MTISTKHLALALGYGCLYIVLLGTLLYFNPGCGKMTTKSGITAVWCSSSTR